MTHSDIKTKFLIEYDKANITSSYPALTDYEIATILDKAYLALIARKLTGNNSRNAAFEADYKAIEDLRPLIVNRPFQMSSESAVSTNERVYDLPSDLLYYLKSVVTVKSGVPSIDGYSHIQEPTILIRHEESDAFRNSSSNLPWIERPVAFIDGNQLRILYDSYQQNPESLIGTYIRIPAKFAGQPNDVINNSDDPTGDYGSGTSEGGNSRPNDPIPDNPTPDDPTPDDPNTQNKETWTVQIDHVAGNQVINQHQFTGRAFSNKGNTDSVVFSLRYASDSQYVTLTSTGLMTVKESLKDAAAYPYVMVRATRANGTDGINYGVNVQYLETEPGEDPNESRPNYPIYDEEETQNQTGQVFMLNRSNLNSQDLLQ